MLANLDELVQKALKNIYGGFEGVEPHLYELTSTVLNEAVEKGLNLKYNVENAAFIHELKSNINVFAAFKAHNQCKDMVALLYDESGKIIPEAKWRKEALKISDHQNKTWLNTERNTALRRARIAAQFKQFDAKKDLYPNLRWLESTAATPRTSHTVFYDMVRSVTDPFWLSHFPGDEWNCKCGIEQTKDPVTDVPEELPESTPGLDSNPYYSKEILTETHPIIASNSIEEKIQVKKELQELLLNEGYDSKPNFKYDNGSKIFIHPLAHKKDIGKNLFYAEFLAQKLPKLIIKIREHLEKDGFLNPEYEINGLIADLKSPTSIKNFKTCNAAIDQGCEVVVFELPQDYQLSNKRFAQEAKSIFNRSSRNKVKYFYIVRNWDLEKFEV